MSYIFLSVFVIAAVIHLYASLKSNKKLRAITKPWLLLALVGYYCCMVENPLCIVIAALLTSWLGDVLLIPKGTKWFAAGGVSFMASHVCFIVAYSRFVDFSVIPVWAIVLCAAVYFTASILVFRGLTDSLPKSLFYPMFFYLLCNGTMNCFALYQLLTAVNTASIVTFIGAVLFFISDSTLFYVRFKKDTIFKTHFVVMLTYIIAEFLIVYGFILHAAM